MALGKRKISEDLSDDQEDYESLLEDAIQSVFEELENLLDDLEQSTGEKDEEALSVLTEVTGKIRSFRSKLTGPSTK